MEGNLIPKAITAHFFTEKQAKDTLFTERLALFVKYSIPLFVGGIRRIVVWRRFTACFLNFQSVAKSSLLKAQGSK